MLEIPRRQFHDLATPRLEGVLVHRAQKKLFGQTRTVLITFNPNLYEGQLQGLTTNLNKARAKLRQLQRQLQRWRDGKIKGGKPPSLEGVQNQVREICSAQGVKLLLKTEVCAVRKGLELTFSTDQNALHHLCQVQFGKTILFTDNHAWSDDQIVLAYRSQYHIEDAFKQMKNPHFLGWSPMFHWTDSKIRVHAFYCVLALLLTSLLQRELAQGGGTQHQPHFGRVGWDSGNADRLPASPGPTATSHRHLSNAQEPAPRAPFLSAESATIRATAPLGHTPHLPVSFWCV